MAQKTSFAKLVDWLEDRLPAQEARQVATEVAADSALRETVAWIQEFRCLTDGIVFAGPPPSLRQRLEALFAERQAGDKESDAWRSFSAELASEQVDKGEQRLAYMTPVAAIMLVVQKRPHEARYDLHGAIRFPGEEQPLMAIEMLQDECLPALQASDHWGEFTFTRLPAGHYQLIFTGEDVELAIPDLLLGTI